MIGAGKQFVHPLCKNKKSYHAEQSYNIWALPKSIKGDPILGLSSTFVQLQGFKGVKNTIFPPNVQKQKVITQKICTHVLTVEAPNGLTHPAIEVPVLGSVLEIEPVQVPLVLVAQLAVLHVPPLPEGRLFSRYRPLSAYRRNSCR